MPRKSIFRQPGAQHFQLVHRSQRDPLIYDPDASTHVLKPIIRENDRKGKSRAELEEELGYSDLTSNSESNAGQAALYGIYYDDTEYDYMQHLRPVGVQEDGVESILIEAPVTSSKTKTRGRTDPSVPGLTIKDLPPEALPSTSELPRTYDSQQAIPDEIAGFQPDMDPHLRQTLEALDDDAFVDSKLEDDFFAELVGEGERGSDEEVEYEFHEDGINNNEETSGAKTHEDGEETWESRFAKFKESHAHHDSEDEDDHCGTEGGDTVSGLPTISVIGGKGAKRRKGSSVASGYSMSSSSMYRNDALQTLDERFDQVVSKVYDSDEEGDGEAALSDDDEAPPLLTSREDFDTMMHEFLDEYEILGRKMKVKLDGDTGAEKLETLRRALGQDQRVIETETDSGEERDVLMEIEERKKDRWDCETIISTYSNLENHPRLIRARETKSIVQITLDSKTGLPLAATASKTKPPSTRPSLHGINSSDDTDESDSELPVRQPVTRPRGESAEAKKERKAAVKAERASRRAQKKATKEEFGNELKVQGKVVANREKQRRMKAL